MRVQQLTGRRTQRSDHGAVALLAALLSVVLFGVAAFAVDLGYAYAEQRKVQNGVDAGALASGRKIAAGALKSDTCATLKAAYTDGVVQAAAQTPFDSNAPKAQISGATVTCEVVAGSTVPQLVVTVDGTEETPTFFAGLFGFDTLEVNRRARVIVGNALPYGLRPFGLCEGDAVKMSTEVAGVYEPYTVVFPSPSDAKDEDNWGCGSASGNAGLLDLNAGGGGRGAASTGCEGIKGWIECGFNGILPNPSSIPGQSGGFGGGLDTAMATLEGKEFALPVYKTVTGSGSATYDIS